MLTLKSLTFNNIGRFVEEQTIDFTALGDLVQVDGQNNNTSGSSGAGKSTIFKALNWCLGLDGPSTSILQSRLTKNPIQVTVIFDFDGLPLKIERGKKLSIDYNGEITTGSSKLTEEKLDQIIGMPRNLFSKILHKEQGSRGFFLEMTASETHSFLSSCLRQEKEQAKLLTLDCRLSYLTDSETSLKTRIESNRTGLEATFTAIASLGPIPELEIDSKTLDALKNAHMDASNRHIKNKAALKTELFNLGLERPTITSQPFDRSRLEQVEKEVGMILAQISQLESVERDRQLKVRNQISELQSKINDLKNTELARQNELKAKIFSTEQAMWKLKEKETKRQADVKDKIVLNRIEHSNLFLIKQEGDKAKAEAIKLAEELNKIRSSICPTCEQSWLNESIKAKEIDILKRLQDYKKSMIAGIEASNKLLAVDVESKYLSEEFIERIDPEAKTLQEHMNRYRIDSRPIELEEIQILNEKISQYKTDSESKSIPEVLELRTKIDFHNQELATIRQEERAHQFKENAKTQAILANYAQKQTELTDKYENIIHLAQIEERQALSAYEAANNKIKSFEEAKERFYVSLSKLTEQKTKYGTDLGSREFELKVTQEEIELATEAKKVIKSYLSCSFEDALDSIGDTATRLIRSIPNMATATIQFEGLKETKEGKIKEEIVCVISMDGEIGVPVKSLSGGERSSADMCIDLSVIKFIQETTGKGISLYIIDEGFNGLDTTCIQDALEMLKNCNLDKQLFLVEHNPIVSQSIENRLIVVRDGLTSKIVQQ